MFPGEPQAYTTKLFMDETTAPVLDPGRGKTKTGYLWPLARDQRGWGGEEPFALLPILTAAFVPRYGQVGPPQRRSACRPY
jgi:hypothetical protein